MTTWHITFGTYGTRLHGGYAITVERSRNRFGDPFVERDATRESREQSLMARDAVYLTAEQRAFIEHEIPRICERGGWVYRICAAPGPPENHHVHVMLDAPADVHGKQVRKWLKRWLSEALSERWPLVPGSWWAEGGSTKVVGSGAYAENVYRYILRQRMTAIDGA